MSFESLNGLRDLGQRNSERSQNSIQNQVQMQFDEISNRIYAQHRSNNATCENLPVLDFLNCQSKDGQSLEPPMPLPIVDRIPRIPKEQIEGNQRVIESYFSPDSVSKKRDRSGKAQNQDFEGFVNNRGKGKPNGEGAAKQNTSDRPSLLDEQDEPNKEIPDNHAPLRSMGAAIDQWDPQIVEAAEKWGVPATQLKAMVWIETGGLGNPDAVQNNEKYGNTYGLTQINRGIWEDTAIALGYDLDTVEGQLGMGAYLLRQGYETRGTWDGATSWYFNPSGTGDSENGTTNAQYIARMHELMGY